MRLLSGILLFLLVLISPAAAHPPRDIMLEYNAGEQALNVSMTHVVSGSLRDHYIRRIVVYKNDVEIAAYTYPTQTSPTTQDVVLPLEAKSDDVIIVRAVCSKGGQAEASLIIPEGGD